MHSCIHCLLEYYFHGDDARIKPCRKCIHCKIRDEMEQNGGETSCISGNDIQTALASIHDALSNVSPPLLSVTETIKLLNKKLALENMNFARYIFYNMVYTNIINIYLYNDRIYWTIKLSNINSSNINSSIPDFEFRYEKNRFTKINDRLLTV